MTFFGSTANDAVFNAYVAEMTRVNIAAKLRAPFFVPFVGSDVARFRDLDQLPRGKMECLFLNCRSCDGASRTAGVRCSASG